MGALIFRFPTCSWAEPLNPPTQTFSTSAHGAIVMFPWSRPLGCLALPTEHVRAQCLMTRDSALGSVADARKRLFFWLFDREIVARWRVQAKSRRNGGKNVDTMSAGATAVRIGRASRMNQARYVAIMLLGCSTVTWWQAPCGQQPENPVSLCFAGSCRLAPIIETVCARSVPSGSLCAH